MKMLATVVIAIAMLAPGATAVIAQGGNDLFQQALVKERTDGDIPAAIKLYQTIVARYPKDRPLVARALVQMAQCHEMLGQRDAIKLYERVVREFGDQVDSAPAARARLLALKAPPLPSRPVLTARQIRAGTDGNDISVSPDGRYIASFFGANTLRSRDLISGTAFASPASIPGLSQDDAGWGEQIAFSPDGRQVAYSWGIDLPNADERELRLMTFAAGESSSPRRLRRFSSYFDLYGWTADGKHLVAALLLPDNSSQIAFIAVADGTVRVLKSLGRRRPSTISVSPDSRFVAYDLPQNATESVEGMRSGFDASPRDIRLLATDGSGSETVVEHRADDSGPIWSGDGSQLLFVSDRTGKNYSLFAVPVEAGRPNGPTRLVKEDIGNVRRMTISRTGALHYTVRQEERRNVYIATLDASMKAVGVPAPVPDQFVHSNGSPAWSRDGEHLAYFSSRSFRPREAPGAEGGLVIRNLRTGEDRYFPLKMTPANTGGAGLEWFPDGRSILAVAQEVFPVSADKVAFYRVDAINGRTELILKNRWGGFNAPEVSADGRSIFHLTPDPEGPAPHRLVQFDLATRRETILRRGQFRSFAQSPDGAEMAMVVMNPTTSRWEIQIMPASGGEPRSIALGTLTGRDPMSGLSWAPDQRSLLFLRLGLPWRVSVSGGEPEPVGLPRMATPHVNPNGRQIAFELTERAATYELWALENFLPVAIPATGPQDSSGFAEPWGAHETYKVATGTLSFPGLTVSDTRMVATITAPSFSARLERRLATPIAAEATTTLYFSALLRPEGVMGQGGGTQHLGWFGVSLAGDGGRLFVGRSGKGTPDQWVLEHAGGAGQVSSGVAAVVGRTVFLVVRAELRPGADVFTLFVNPDPCKPLSGSGTVKNDLDLGNLSRAAVSSAGAFSFDEFRAGPTFETVAPCSATAKVKAGR